MHSMRKWLAVLVVAVPILGLIGCSSDPTGSAEYRALAADLEAVTAERDAVASESAAVESAAETRREKSMETMTEIMGIIDNPSSVGSEEEVLDELMTHVAQGAVMDDSVFGAVPVRSAWRNTLYGGRDARIETWHRWMAADGSQGGALWTWSGINYVGEPFELIGVAITEYDEEGKETYQFVTYPYEDEVVRAAVTGVGSPGSAADPLGPVDFLTDDLCERVTAEQVATFVEEAYGWEAVVVDVAAGSRNCEWVLNGDGGQGRIQVGEAVWESFGGGPYDMAAAFDTVVDYSEVDDAYVPIGASVFGHPSLSEGVVVHNGGFGQFAFGVPPLPQYLQVWVEVPGDHDWETSEPKFLTVANRFIDAFGWLPES